MAKKKNVTTNVKEEIKALPNKGKPNWGTLKGKPIIVRLTLFNLMRKNSILTRNRQARERDELYIAFPGHFEQGSAKGATKAYVTDDKEQQVVFNEKLNALEVAHKEQLKQERKEYTALYDSVMPENFYKSYKALATYAVDKKEFKEQVYKYLVNGLGIKGLTKQGLEKFTQTICDTVGLKLTSESTFAKTDRDVEPMNQATFYKTVMGLTRDILIEKGVIKTDALLKDEGNKQVTTKDVVQQVMELAERVKAAEDKERKAECVA